MISDQIKMAKNGFQISNHAFLTAVANAAIKCINNEVPELPLTITKKQVNSDSIQVQVVGSHAAEEIAIKDMSEKVAQVIATFKDPAVILDVLEK
jgi:hypothetical protein